MGFNFQDQLIKMKNQTHKHIYSIIYRDNAEELRRQLCTEHSPLDTSKSSYLKKQIWPILMLVNKYFLRIGRDYNEMEAQSGAGLRSASNK